MSDLREQLKRWAGLEVARCERIDNGFFVRIPEANYSYCFYDYEPLNLIMALFIVQSAVQAAIVARGWDYSLQYLCQISEYTTVTLLVPDEKEKCITARSISASGHSPALALLQAYCDSLEAMR